MKKLVAAVALAGAAITSLSFSAPGQAQDTIRFGMEATYPPFEFFNEKNELTGFDVELATAICAELDTTCEFSNQPFDSLIPGLKFRRFDAVISGMDITPKRMEQVAFTQPYYENSAIFVAASKNDFKEAKDLIGKTVGVQNGSTHQAYLIDKLEKQGVKTRPYDSYQNALLDMTNGRVDAVFADTAVAREWLVQQSKGQYQTVGEEVKDANYFGIGMGIAARKGDLLVEKLNTALAGVKESGLYQQLHAKYFNSAEVR
ncbi:transporter substrate-binding domain-containing protein [Endozoicomonas sp. SCSIO W0465]|uniref:transporter substrate-binding domain-containing protein n=1 Tax=Endozoicomonas sp. SCSIO W0465 TaxID=2918516 RepID=UPI0020755BFB|nr:transporter substrate-binding domain-containing protein [Endozoicomonas sp. SCSIO W0465]USE34755.1 transporter substrate-binding domain-containing protein [Endozoicomonas sp. SCSIO W0465]